VADVSEKGVFNNLAPKEYRDSARLIATSTATPENYISQGPMIMEKTKV